jgi:hypothetical protein
MLQDIPNPFPQVVTRNPRSSHTGGHNPGEGIASGRLTIPVGPPAGHADATEPTTAGHPPDGGPDAPRITPEPGPREVVPPRWWGHLASSTPRLVDREADSSSDGVTNG